MAGYSSIVSNNLRNELFDLFPVFTRSCTYAQVFDYFAQYHRIIITLLPFMTFALKNNIGYTWAISYNNGVKLQCIHEEDELGVCALGGSFQTSADNAIHKAISICHELGKNDLMLKYETFTF